MASRAVRKSYPNPVLPRRSRTSMVSVTTVSKSSQARDTDLSEKGKEPADSASQKAKKMASDLSEKGKESMKIPTELSERGKESMKSASEKGKGLKKVRDALETAKENDKGERARGQRRCQS
ncbi:hypothetical protein AMTR_s00037p00237420 [Amborella trichopoda]|uniref:Uncharacterized protein n=1 Tax=Amborella trichopoda TaxID=13333 RepID=U5D7Q0_AMBTC|nr:hypothetical protein AMTR_s00037p00237420 [Amborella trichopoda]